MNDNTDHRVTALHLAWAVFQRRQVAMAPLAGFECLFLPLTYKGGSHFMRGLHYLVLAWRTWRVLALHRPQELWLQLPQVPLLWVALLYRTFSLRPMRIVADCHNAMFSPPWSSMPGGISLLSRCELVLVHNDQMLAAALALGLPADKLRVLEDVPAAQMPKPEAPPAWLADLPRPWVLMAGSYGRDEPVAEVLQAAGSLVGQATVIITGRLSNAQRNGHDISAPPANVRLTDYVPVQQFDNLMGNADVVLALTRFDGIQLSACNEALGFGRALVVSDTPLLRRMFDSAAVVADSGDPAALANAIRAAAARQRVLENASAALARRRRDDWLGGPWKACRELLDAQPGAVPEAA
jgi:Glycosyl transferases group 1